MSQHASRAQHASCVTCSHLSHVPRALGALVPEVTRTLHALVRHVCRALRALVLYVLRVIRTAYSCLTCFAVNDYDKQPLLKDCYYSAVFSIGDINPRDPLIYV